MEEMVSLKRVGEDVSSYWMTLRKTEVTGNWKRKLQIALFEELTFEEFMVLS
jgi:hypothetical protein